MVAAFGVDGEGADDLAGGGVNDAHVVAVDEQNDAGSVEGSPDTDVVEVAVDAQGDGAGGDAVVADAVLVAGRVSARGGFGACRVGGRRGGPVWQ